ncbi:hypothetical protein AURDEDRAFT_131764 [Auricularia subglabra TFB-10046 SS5]|uniref:Uncharacterized protein n=1 Tax=Auricularia subglabra (strain TFB-10046 / SS5) TaxID=717982 RepID=J0WN79_AURST|nr:hypothetical protein AURDEDRAFT_131764 [Auricularia subglabra TFB-10046 SS5]
MSAPRHAGRSPAVEPPQPSAQEGLAEASQAPVSTPVQSSEPPLAQPFIVNVPRVSIPVVSTPVVTTRSGNVVKKKPYVPKPRKRRAPEPAPEAELPGAFPAPLSPLSALTDTPLRREELASRVTSPLERGSDPEHSKSSQESPRDSPLHRSDSTSQHHDSFEFSRDSFSQSREADNVLLNSPGTFGQSTPIVVATVFATPADFTPTEHTPVQTPVDPIGLGLPDSGSEQEDPWTGFGDKIADAKTAIQEAEQSTPGRPPIVGQVMGKLAASSLDVFDLLSESMKQQNLFLRDLGYAFRSEVDEHADRNTVDILNELTTVFNALTHEQSSVRLASFEQVTTILSLLSHSDNGFLSRLDAIQKILQKVHDAQQTASALVTQLEQKSTYETAVAIDNGVKDLRDALDAQQVRTEFIISALEKRLDMATEEIKETSARHLLEVYNALESSANARAHAMFDALVRDLKPTEKAEKCCSCDNSKLDSLFERLVDVERAILERNGLECPCLFGRPHEPRESPDDKDGPWKRDSPPHIHHRPQDETLGHEKPEPQSFFIDASSPTRPMVPGPPTTTDPPQAAPPHVHFPSPPVTGMAPAPGYPTPAAFPSFFTNFFGQQPPPLSSHVQPPSSFGQPPPTAAAPPPTAAAPPPTAAAPLPKAAAPPPTAAAPPRAEAMPPPVSPHLPVQPQMPAPGPVPAAHDATGTPAPAYASQGPPYGPPPPLGGGGGVPPPPPPSGPGAFPANDADPWRASQGSTWSTGRGAGQVYPKMRVPFDHLLANLPMLLAGEAREWITTLAPETRESYTTWEEWSDALRMEFREANYLAKKGQELRQVLIDLEPSLVKKSPPAQRDRPDSQRRSGQPRFRPNNARETSTTTAPTASRSAAPDSKPRTHAPASSQTNQRRFAPGSGAGAKAGQSAARANDSRPAKTFLADPQPQDDVDETEEDEVNYVDDDEASEHSSDAYDSDEGVHFAESYAVTTRSSVRVPPTFTESTNEPAYEVDVSDRPGSTNRWLWFVSHPMFLSRAREWRSPEANSSEMRSDSDRHSNNLSEFELITWRAPCRSGLAYLEPSPGPSVKPGSARPEDGRLTASGRAY